MVTRPAQIDVHCVGPGAERVAARLAEADDTFQVGVAFDRERGLEEAEAADALDGEGTDCVVGVGDAAVDGTLGHIAAAAPNAVRVARVDAEDIDAALDAGATDIVTASGDGAAALVHRIRTAVGRERAAAEPDETEAVFEALINNTSFAVVTVDADSVVQYASPAVKELFGYAPAELVGEPLMALMPERFHEAHREAVEQYLTTGERRLDWGWIEFPAEHRDGTEIPLGVSFGEYTQGDDHLFSAVIRDVSDRKQRQERLDRLASAVEGSMDGVAILDEDERFQYVNDAHVDVYEYDDADELLGEHWSVLYGADERDRIESEVLNAVERDGQWRGEAIGQRADDSTFPQELSLTELDDGGLVCVVRDVTERVQQRRELREERQFIETVIDTLPDVFYVLDGAGRITRWNDRMVETSGYTEAQLEGMHALELIPPDDHEAVSRAISRVVKDGESTGVRSALLTARGNRIPHDFSGNAVTDADGEVIGLAGIGRDISDTRRRQQRLAVLSRVLRHNVRNYTNVVQGQTAYVRDALDDPDLRAALETADAAAADLASMSDRARRLEDLLRDDPATPRPVDLSDIVQQGYRQFEADTDGDTDLRVDIPESAWATATDDVAVAVTELLRNAHEHVEAPTARLSVETDDSSVAVVVADDGPGIPENERAAIREGEETALSHGTGLGLWLVKWVVTGAGGRVAFREGDLGGAAVALSFPASTSPGETTPSE